MSKQPASVLSSAAPWSPDPEQEAVLQHRDGVLLVLGAPGSGKTSTVVRHVQRRIVGDGLTPDSCLVLAPTRQAAAALRDSIGRGLGQTFTDPLARTPSSLAFAILRLAAAGSGEPLPRLLSGAEQDVILRELLAGHAAEGRGPAWPAPVLPALPTAGFRGQLRDLLMRAVEHGLEAGDLAELGASHGRPEWAAAAEVLEEYDQVTALSEPGSYDPAWICTAAADVLEEDPELRRRLQGSLRMLVVDDAQELTASAARLIQVLHPPGTAALLVGDPDATVLGFRGAVPGRFVQLARDLATAAGDPLAVPTVSLRTSYRAGSALTEVSDRVAQRIGAVHGLAHRRPTPSPAPAPSDQAGVIARDGTDSRVEVAVARSRAQEVAYVGRWIRAAHLLDGVPWQDIAVLARSGAQQETVRRALSAAGVPVQVDRSSLPLGQDPAVVPLLLAFDVVTRDTEHGAGWAATGEEAVALLTSPLGDVDPVHLRRLRRRLRAAELSEGGERSADEILAQLLADPGLRATPPSDLHPDLAPVVKVGAVLEAGREISTGTPAGSAEDILWALWAATGLASRWEAQALGGGALGARADRDLDAVLVLFGAAESYVERLPGRSPRSFLEHVRSAEVAADTLVVGARSGAAVEVLTPQAAAGRQWRLVAVVGVQDGVWPDLRLRDTLLGSEALVAAVGGRAVDGPEALRAAQSQVRADELRQFHVAVSRARERLLVTAVASTDDQPSGFLDLVDPAHRDRPPVEVPPPLTLRGLVGQLRRDAVLAQRDGRRAERDQAIDTLLVLAAADVAGADPSRWWDGREVSRTDPLVPEGPVRVSPSRVQTYLDCPLRWFLTGRGADTGEAVSADIGTLVHDIVAEQPGADAETLVADLDRRWGELGLPPGWVSEKQQRAAQEMVHRYARYAEQSRAEGRELVGVEIDLLARITPEGATSGSTDGSPGAEPAAGPDRVVDIVGRVDRLERDAEGRLIVLDLKTSRTKPSREEILSHAQLASYQVAVEAGAFDRIHPGARSGGAELVNLGCTTKEIAQAQPPVADSEDPTWARRMLLEAGQQMAGSTFRAHDLGQRCRRCPARFCCPLQPEGQAR